MFVQLVTLQNYFNALMEGIHPQGYQKICTFNVSYIFSNDAYYLSFVKR